MQRRTAFFKQAIEPLGNSDYDVELLSVYRKQLVNLILWF